MIKYWLLTISLIFATSSVFAQSSASPPYGLSPLEAYSIFVESYKNKDYQTGLMYGRWLVNHSPKTLEGYPAKYDGSRTMSRMITIYEEIAKSKEDPAVRSTYLDSALILYNRTLELFNEEEIDKFDWRLRKARFLQEHSSYISDALPKAYSIYMDLFQQNPQKLAGMGDGYYVQITLQNLVSKGEKQKALDMIEKAEPYANQKLKDFFDKMRNQLFDSPEERMAFLESELKENPDDVKILSELFKIYSDEEMTEKANETARKLYELNPNYENTKRLAENALDNANYQLAIKFLKEAIEKTDDEHELRQIAMDLSQTYLNLENLQQARFYARKAIQYDPNYGQAYLQMARIYGQAVGKCTEDEMTRKDRMVYWLVLDYLDKAKRVDPRVSSSVNQLYSSYKPVVPTSEDKFFMGLKAGEKVKIDESLDSCYSWINETTTVR